MGLRTYPTPAAIRDGDLGSHPTMDEIDLFVTSGRGTDTERRWAANVWTKHVAERVDSVMAGRVAAGDPPRLPLGVVSCTDDTDIVVGLLDGDEVWRGKGWVQEDLRSGEEPFRLTTDEVAFSVDAITGGATGMALLDIVPVGRVEEIGSLLAASDIPPDGKVVAVVDDFDPNAVLDLLLVTPGPKVQRRSNGQWMTDRGYLAKLTSGHPPKLVVLSSGQVDDVVQQVDQSTVNEKFKEYNVMHASGFAERADEMAIAFSLLAANSPKYIAYDVTGKMPGNLQRYWTVGEGAAKIRWGTPGAWRRCYRHLVKYVGPQRAPGVCTNLGKRLGGKNVAWNVGGRRGGH